MSIKYDKVWTYDYSSLIDSYINNTHNSGATAKLHNTNYRMSYQGVNLYSYTSLLAEIDRTNKILYIDIDISKYSVTTAKHVSLLRNNMHQTGFNIFHIDLSLTPIENLVLLWEIVVEAIGTATRARSLKPHRINSVHLRISEAQQFAKVHSLDSSVPTEITKSMFVNKLLK